MLIVVHKGKTRMDTVKKLSILTLTIFLSGCSLFDIYSNADEPVNWKGKENWGFLSVKNNGGRVLVSPRPLEDGFSAFLSAGNHKARSQILLKPGINNINVYAMYGNLNSIFTIKNIKIKENGKYQLEYKFENRTIKTKITEVTNNNKK